VRARIPLAAVGEGVTIAASGRTIAGRIEAISDGIAIVVPFDALEGIAVGTPISIDPGAPDRCVPPDVAQRAPIDRPMWTGVRTIDGLRTIGRGARVGIFGAPGTGKSSLLRAIVANACIDAVVIAAVGERGREAQEWLECVDERTSIAYATSDRPAAQRVRVADEAFARAHHLRRRGLHVLVLFDSLARYAGALRELGVAAGEGLGRGGFPASVFARLACLLEVAGATHEGSISVIATVLDDGDARDPISDAARSLLDGHIALSPALARAGHFPAIDVPASASRTMQAVTTSPHRADAAVLREALAWLERTQDARSLGLPTVDEPGSRFLAGQEALETFVRQDDQASPPSATLVALRQTADILR
jgi:type III secretion protein N (ATPase)